MKVLEVKITQGVKRPDVGLRVDFSKGEWWRCRHDFERAEFGAIEKNGKIIKYGKPRQLMPGYEQKKPMPQTVMSWQLPTSDGGFIPFTKEWQLRTKELMGWAVRCCYPKGLPDGERTGRYWKKINGKKVFGNQDPYSRVEYTPFSMMSVWEDTYSDSVALSDQHAFDNGRADYVQGLNLNAPPMDIKRLWFGGLPVNILRTENQYKIVETLDPTLPPPPLHWILENRSHCIGWANEIGCLENQELPDGRWTVAMFGKFKPAAEHYGFEAMGVPYFLFGRGGWNRIKTEHLIRMEREEYSVYVPEK